MPGETVRDVDLDVREGGSTRRLAVAEAVTSFNRTWEMPAGTLSPGTAYAVRVVAVNDVGSTAEGAWMSFSTLAYGAPVIGEITVTDVTRTGCIGKVLLTELGSGSDSVDLVFELSADAAFAQIAASGTNNVSTFGRFEFGIAYLEPGTTYYVRVTATGSNGLVSQNATVSFTTLAATPPSATVEVSEVGFTTATARGSLVAH